MLATRMCVQPSSRVEGAACNNLEQAGAESHCHAAALPALLPATAAACASVHFRLCFQHCHRAVAACDALQAKRAQQSPSMQPRLGLQPSARAVGIILPGACVLAVRLKIGQQACQEWVGGRHGFRVADERAVAARARDRHVHAPRIRQEAHGAGRVAAHLRRVGGAREQAAAGVQVALQGRWDVARTRHTAGTAGGRGTQLGRQVCAAPSCLYQALLAAGSCPKHVHAAARWSCWQRPRGACPPC